MPFTGTLERITLAAVLLAASAPAGAQPVTDGPHTDSIVDNPFAGFDTWRLSNGMKVWFRRYPGAPDVFVSVAVPYGYDQDPEGKEELAHFTEHMLFSDHDDRTEREIKSEVEQRGGQRNGVTTPDRTYFFVGTRREHGLFPLEWLAGILEPHAMQPEVVDRNRRPVALEIGARPRELFDWVWAVLNPAWLRPPGYWEREYGLETRSSRVYDEYASLHAITSEDLRGFYDRYYAPGALTLTVIGDLDTDLVRRRTEALFGGLPERPVSERDMKVSDPGRETRRFFWAFHPNVSYREDYKFFDVDAREHVLLLFLEDYLGHRLNTLLRFGREKAVYGVRVYTLTRGPAVTLRIEAEVAPSELDYAREVVAEELQALRAGRPDPTGFEDGRNAVIQTIQSDAATSERLGMWVFREFFDPSRHESFPDLPTAFRELSPAELAAFAGPRLVPERRVLRVIRPQPLTQGLVAGMLFLLVGFTVWGTGRGLRTPVRMGGIRYVARFRVPLPLAGVLWALFAASALVVLRLLYWLLERVALRWVVPVESYLYQTTIFALLTAMFIAVLVVLLSLVPRKLLVFEDHLRIKFLAYRSRTLALADVEVGYARLPDLGGRDLLRTLPLALGLLRPALLLRSRTGPAYLFRVRDTEELFRVLRGLGVRLASGSEGSGAHPPGRMVEGASDEAVPVG